MNDLKKIYISSSVCIDVQIELDVSSAPPNYGPNFTEWFGEWFKNQFIGAIGRMDEAKIKVGDPYVYDASFAMGTTSHGGYSRTHLSEYGEDKELHKMLETAFVRIVEQLPEVKALGVVPQSEMQNG